MITISKELLESAGYKCWKENPEHEPHIVRKWQKRIMLYDGETFQGEAAKTITKYFIDINETHGWNPHLNSGEEFHNFWPSVQFNINVGNAYQSVNIQLVQWFNEAGQHSEITIAEMEEKIDEIFTTLEGHYYDN